MTATTLRKRIQEAVENVDDEKILEAIYALVNKAQKRNSSLRPMTLEDMVKRVRLSEKDIQSGKTMSVDAVRKRYTKGK